MQSKVEIDVMGAKWEFVFDDLFPYSDVAEIWVDEKTVTVDNKARSSLPMLTFILTDYVAQAYLLEADYTFDGTTRGMSLFIAHYAEDILTDVNKIIMELGCED